MKNTSILRIFFKMQQHKGTSFIKIQRKLQQIFTVIHGVTPSKTCTIAATKPPDVTLLRHCNYLSAGKAITIRFLSAANRQSTCDKLITLQLCTKVFNTVYI
jgi:hypothetical protein